MINSVNNFQILTQKKSLFFAIGLLVSSLTMAGGHKPHGHHHEDHASHTHKELQSFEAGHRLQIVTSIAPLQSLVKNVVGDNHNVKVLIKQKSVHIDHLKPSQLRSVVNADIVIHLHDELEFFISNLPKSTLPHNKRITIAKHLTTPLLKRAEEHHDEHHDEHKDEHHGEHHDEHKDSHHKEAHDDEHDEHHGHDHSSEFDLHFWLDPLMAMQIVDIVTAELSEAMPSEAEVFAQNAQRYKRTLKKLHNSIQKQMTATSDTKFLVFHNAYAYFIHQYGLENQLVASEQFLMSLKEVAELKEKVANNTYACAIIDEEHSSKNITKLLTPTGLQLFYLNPIGLDFRDPATSSKELYVKLLSAIASTFSKCLQ